MPPIAVAGVLFTLPGLVAEPEVMSDAPSPAAVAVAATLGLVIALVDGGSKWLHEVATRQATTGAEVA